MFSIDASRNLSAVPGASIGIGTNAPTSSYSVTVVHAINRAIRAVSSAGIGALVDEVDASLGILGTSTATAGATVGVLGRTTHLSGVGVRGTAETITSAPCTGVYGASSATNGVGVYASGATTGVHGIGRDNGNAGLSGIASATTGVTTGVRGVADSTHGTAVLGHATATTGTTHGVMAVNRSSNGTGAYAHGRRLGVRGWGTTPRDIAVKGEATSTTGTNYGIYAANYAEDEAIYGYGGLIGSSSSTTGVFGDDGMLGWASSRTGVGVGIYGDQNIGDYGIFVLGAFTATGTKSFIHPHPSDAGRVVQFICLEGNEAGTYFRGRAALRGGAAVIPVPEEWRLVTDAAGVSVQLTAVGAPAQLWVVETSRERIEVRGTADCEFCYFVQGVRAGATRSEPFAKNEVFRPTIRGVPYGNQYPREFRDLLVANGLLNADDTPNEATMQRLGFELVEPDSIPPQERWWLPADERERLVAARREQRPQPSAAPVRPSLPAALPR